MWNLLNKAEPFTKKAERFWAWFARNEDSLAASSADQKQVNKVVAQISKELDKVQRLAFEFGGENGGKINLVISADGIKKDFPTVASLCKLAPPLRRWNVIAFRDRKPEFNGTLQANGMEFGVDSCAFKLTHGENGLIDLILYMPGLTDATYAACGSIGFLLLDAILGEFDVATKLGVIDFEPLTDEVKLAEKPASLLELREAFDAMQQVLVEVMDCSGTWQGRYQYVNAETAIMQDFPFSAKFSLSGEYLSGTMSDNSDLGEASISGLVRGNVIVFEKAYGRPELDKVLYYGRINSEGKSMAGRWQLDGKRQSLDGAWSAEK